MMTKSRTITSAAAATGVLALVAWLAPASSALVQAGGFTGGCGTTDAAQWIATRPAPPSKASKIPGLTAWPIVPFAGTSWGVQVTSGIPALINSNQACPVALNIVRAVSGQSGTAGTVTQGNGAVCVFAGPLTGSNIPGLLVPGKVARVSLGGGTCTLGGFTVKFGPVSPGFEPHPLGCGTVVAGRVPSKYKNLWRVRVFAPSSLCPSAKQAARAVIKGYVQIARNKTVSLNKKEIVITKPSGGIRWVCRDPHSIGGIAGGCVPERNVPGFGWAADRQYEMDWGFAFKKA